MKKEVTGNVFVVYCVDTESNAFNYNKHEQSLNLNSFKSNNIIEQMFEKTVRHQYTDSFGQCFKLTWFLMSIEGYRYTPQGINAIAEEFIGRFIKQCTEVGDEIGWHYHHADWYKDTLRHQYGWNQITTFSNVVYNEKTDRQLALWQYASFVYLNKLVPSSFRAGWNWENTQFSNWLDSLIPFDYSNNWQEVEDTRFLYHPDEAMLYKSGNLSRQIVRSVSAADSTYMASLFAIAKDGKDVIFSTYTHNYGGTVTMNNPMKNMVSRTNRQLHLLSKKYNVKFKYCTATEAINLINHLSDCPDYNLNCYYNDKKKVIYAVYNTDTFGTPLVVSRTGEHIKAQFMKLDTHTYSWFLDIQDMDIDTFQVISLNKCGKSYLSEKYIY